MQILLIQSGKFKPTYMLLFTFEKEVYFKTDRCRLWK